MTEVKICGVSRRRDVEAAAEAGASYVGLVFAESPRRVGPGEAAALAALARSLGLEPVGVFVDRAAGEVRSLAGEAGLPVVQLHGRETPETCRGLRDGGLEVWKALRPRDPGELTERAAAYADAADALLVEGHSEEAAGGTGTPVPPAWLEALEGMRASFRLVLAGGLEPDSVADAVREVRPDVVDVSSGVERRPGEKDAARIREFVSRALSALEGSREDGS